MRYQIAKNLIDLNMLDANIAIVDQKTQTANLFNFTI